ncbi:MAG: ribosome assembly RNA-binding protein YhbY [Gammaproteobacteria bacterium]|nr:ribosome assembly RNA-binding protein YhbY [Gammaproteobacteria bacterium]
MALSKHQIKHLVSLTHNLKPVIMVGQNGVTENILKELDIALDFHELVKIKIAGEDRESRAEMIKQLSSAESVEIVQKIGKTLTLYRKNKKKPKIELPNK